MSDVAYKVRENRIRRMAERRRYRLVKSRRRDRLAPDFGVYWLYVGDLNVTRKEGMTLDEVERFLNEPH